MKVLLINPYIPEYRIPVFRILGEKIDLTVLHSGKFIEFSGINFKQIIIPLKKLGPFRYFQKRLSKICKEFDLVISEANLRHIDRDLIILNPFRKFKWIAWGIGVSASYNKGFDQDRSMDFLRYFVFRRADANVFYSDYPVKKYVKHGFPSEALFVADNTTLVVYNNHLDFKRDSLLFVGTLYKQKKIFDLLEAYGDVYSVNANIPLLNIIGSGPEEVNVKEWIRKQDLDSKIIVHGAIYDNSILEHFFRTALACISPGQAGLSVLTSLGYGTPFITTENAITGGEILNIRDGINGRLYKTQDQLKSIIIDITDNSLRYVEMGEKGREFYVQNRQVKNMVTGLLDAINFVMEGKNIRPNENTSN